MYAVEYCAREGIQFQKINCIKIALRTDWVREAFSILRLLFDVHEHHIARTLRVVIAPSSDNSNK